MCSFHYRRKLAGVSFDKRRRGDKCIVANCDRVGGSGDSLCHKHHYRKQQGLPLDAEGDLRNRHKVKNGTRRLLKDTGYMQIKITGGFIYEHRHVMQEHIGRMLESHETVHHLNGNRADNRLENLELWSSSHPPGQRVEDKIRWAKQFLALYGLQVIQQES